MKKIRCRFHSTHLLFITKNKSKFDFDSTALILACIPNFFIAFSTEPTFLSCKKGLNFPAYFAKQLYIHINWLANRRSLWIDIYISIQALDEPVLCDSFMIIYSTSFSAKFWTNINLEHLKTLNSTDSRTN